MEFKLNNFDVLRLLAAYQVLIGHTLSHFGLSEVPLFGYFPGVPIFFAISGFLISASWERSQTLSGYFKNRFLRIYPALWFCFLLSVFVVSLTYDFRVFSVDFLKWSLAQLTIGQFYNPDFFRDYGVGVVNGSLWTIPVELQFYLSIPIIYLIMNKLRWSNLIFSCVIVLFSVINYYKYQYQVAYGESLFFKLFAVTVIPYLNMFLFGVLLQKNLHLVERFLANKVFVWLGFYVLSIVLTEIVGARNAGNAINPASAFMLTLLIISAAYSHVDKFSNILKGNDISYGVYIYHMIFINLLLSLNLFSSMINAALVILVTTIVATLSWRFLEKPALSLKTVKLR
ncbi:acyltransferase family protein [Vibrio sinaloensis]|uniref:acyltransferase family protein n=1 Tax=Photobacterium sp. (strain ATCC 43367) TaxID=379097 RepID=UPI00068B3272|nr:acyltransferase [Vibrio sinaloensis]